MSESPEAFGKPLTPGAPYPGAPVQWDGGTWTSAFLTGFLRWVLDLVLVESDPVGACAAPVVGKSNKNTARNLEAASSSSYHDILASHPAVCPTQILGVTVC